MTEVKLVKGMIKAVDFANNLKTGGQVSFSVNTTVNNEYNKELTMARFTVRVRIIGGGDPNVFRLNMTFEGILSVKDAGMTGDTITNDLQIELRDQCYANMYGYMNQHVAALMKETGLNGFKLPYKLPSAASVMPA